MGMDIPATALPSMLNAQEKWEKDKAKRSAKEHLHKRCDSMTKYKNMVKIVRHSFKYLNALSKIKFRLPHIQCALLRN